MDFRFQEKMRGVVEYMQYREMPSDIKRKVALLVWFFIFCRHGSPSCWWGIEGGMLWVGNLIELQHIIYIIYYW